MLRITGMGKQQDLHEITVSLILAAQRALEAAAARRSLSKTDVINRAVQMYDFFDAETAAGAEVVLRYPSGEASTVTFRF